jgi:tight adherence protein C
MIFILMGVFLSVFCLIWAGLKFIFAQKILIGVRLEEVKGYAPKSKWGMEDELQKGFEDRVLKPMLQKMSAITQKYTPLKQRELTEKKLTYAGRPLGWSAADFLSVQYTTAVILGIAAYILSFVSHATPGEQYMAGIGGFICGYVLLYTFLKVNISRRQVGIEKELPDMLDLLTISIEAGLGFDAALQKVVQKSQGPLAQDFNQSLQEMRMGKIRKEALRDLGLRNKVSDLNNFVGAIIQADQLGVSMGNVLRTQSEQMRVLRKQRVEEKAMKAPIKMLLPLVLFIFPTIFLIILGPMVLQIMDTMK